MVYKAIPKGCHPCSDYDIYEKCINRPLKLSSLCAGFIKREQVIFLFSKELTENIKYRKEQSPWINVKKQLPQSTDWYFVRYANGYDSPIYGEAFWNNGFNSYNHLDSENITHYMPIPSLDDILATNKDVLKRLKEK